MKPNVSHSTATAILVAVVVLLAGCSGLSEAGPSTPADDSVATESTPTTTTETPEPALSGRLLVVVEGEERHLSTSADSDFRFDDQDRHTWHATESMSLAAALETAGVNATDESLTIDGRTYDESDENTTITYRVAGTPIEDPREYRLEDLDPAHELVVRVDTDGQQSADRLLDQSHPHSHGQLDMTVAGEPVEFTQDRYVLASERFHFHGDEGGERWHAHSLSLTVADALSTFPGTNVSGDTMTYDGTTYRENGTSSSFVVTVDGDRVDPDTYVLKDGDQVAVTLDETDP
ncbi:hypothetical protein [Haloarcula onubensis]|uniref:Uncharacterized protein n=1 Tax=Haloarcula onubensis TaxID=2950539 RepID=A0ABU2FPD4_9EURY|nr:hypothetical protein [Halomicroarcula sp. S3CR25-11]MDS0282633.1 hypothetical protein [Halomicroarcula sp. S3CR25-11]